MNDDEVTIADCDAEWRTVARRMQTELDKLAGQRALLREALMEADSRMAMLGVDADTDPLRLKICKVLNVDTTEGISIATLTSRRRAGTTTKLHYYAQCVAILSQAKPWERVRVVKALGLLVGLATVPNNPAETKETPWITQH